VDPELEHHVSMCGFVICVVVDVCSSLSLSDLTISYSYML
jgi:hypothetical protein